MEKRGIEIQGIAEKASRAAYLTTKNITENERAAGDRERERCRRQRTREMQEIENERDAGDRERERWRR